MANQRRRIDDDQLLEVICRALRWDQSRINPATPIRSEDQDGTRRASVALALNEEFNLHLTAAHAQRWHTVHDVIRSAQA